MTDTEQRLYNAMYNTKLNGLDNLRYYRDKMLSPAFRNDNGIDYDLRGYWADQIAKQNAGLLPKGSGFPKQGHLPDTFKKPNHITFSTHSQYSNGDTQGGQWQQLPDGSWTFTPSAYNLTQYSPKQYQDYFNKYEQGNKVILN